MTIIFLVVTALLCTGIITVYSVTSVSNKYDGYFEKHLLSIALGIGLMFLSAHIDYHILGRPFIFRGLVIVTILLLTYVLLFGAEVNGSKRWIHLLGQQFQPSELAKITTVVFLSVKLAANQRYIATFWRGFVPPLVIAMVFISLIVPEPDLGVPVVILCTTFAMMFVSGVNVRYLTMSIAPVLVGVAMLIYFFPYRIGRILAWLDPWQYRLTKGFHLIQSLAAFGRGGLWGVGPGAGEQKLQYLPEAHTDFVFAAWAEEVGLVGTLILAAMFFLILLVAIRIAKCAPDLMGSLLATGIVSLIVCQALVNMAVTTGMLPTKGLPLPFVSYGGTAMMVFLGLVGILFNIARQCHELPNSQLNMIRGTT